MLHRRVQSLIVADGRCRGARLHGGGEIRADVVLNVAGPWVDAVLGVHEQRPLIGGTKGSHLVVGRFPGAPSEALYVEAEDGRPYFIVPWNDLYLIGTTDTRYRGDLDHVVATDEEIEYLISATNEVIPGARLTRDDVLYTYAGVRPLPWTEDSEGSITRRHIIHDHAPEVEGLLSIVGGKLTTYRHLAEQAVDAVYGKLGRDVPGVLDGGPAASRWGGGRLGVVPRALPPRRRLAPAGRRAAAADLRRASRGRPGARPRSARGDRPLDRRARRRGRPRLPGRARLEPGRRAGAAHDGHARAERRRRTRRGRGGAWPSGGSVGTRRERGPRCGPTGRRWPTCARGRSRSTGTPPERPAGAVSCRAAPSSCPPRGRRPPLSPGRARHPGPPARCG